jgi:hypothetical protein
VQSCRKSHHAKEIWQTGFRSLLPNLCMWCVTFLHTCISTKKKLFAVCSGNERHLCASTRFVFVAEQFVWQSWLLSSNWFVAAKHFSAQQKKNGVLKSHFSQGYMLLENNACPIPPTPSRVCMCVIRSSHIARMGLTTADQITSC